MYQYPAVPGPPKGTISPEDIFLETQFSLANNPDPLAVPTFEVPASPRRTWGDSQMLEVVIRHRTRSQKGWTPIATDDKIRVTKDRGKVFQLVVDSPAPFAKEGIVLNLEMNGQIVPVDPSSPACGLKLARVSSVTSRMEGMQTRYSAELSIKISALCDKLRVVASVATDSHHVLTGKTVEFMTHNNGKVPNSQKDAEEAPKKLQFVVPSPTSSVNGNPMMINPQIVKSPYPDVMIINNSNIEAPSGSCGTFRGDQRHTSKRSLGSSGPSNNPTTPGNNSNNGGTVNGSGSGGNKRSKVTFEDGPNNMNILYNKLMEAAPESPPHPPVGDCSSPDYGVAMSVEEPPLSQMKKRKFTPTSPPHTQGQHLQQHPAGGHHAVTPMMSPYAQSNPYLSPVGYPLQPMPMPVHLYHNTPPMQQPQQQQHHHAYHASRPHRSSDNSDSDSNSDRHSSGGVPQHWDHQQQASFSPQSTPEEEYEMQEMAHGGGGGGSGGASGQGSEEEEYTSSSNNNSNISLLHGKPSNALQVINGDLSVRGAVRARAYMQYSDIRLKTDVEDIVDAIDLIAKLDGKRYRWKPDAFEAKKIGKGLPIGGAHDSDDSAATNSDNSDSDSDDDERSEDIESAGSETPLFSPKHALSNFGFSSNDDDLEEEVDHKKRGEKVIGLIAQEVQRVLPEVVTEDEDGYLAVAYAEIVPVLISAFNEHMSNYNFEQLALKRKFEKFEAQLAELTEEKEMTDKETLAELAQEMKELLPETKYSRLVKKLSRMRRKDKIIQRNCCVLLICMFCFVIGLSIALAIISPISFQNVYNIIDNATGNTNSNSNTNYVGDGTYARIFQITGLSASSITLLGTRTDTSAGLDYLQLTASTKIGNGAAPPFTLAVSHALVANRRREIQEEKAEMTISSPREEDKEDKEEATRANSKDDAMLALNFTYSLVSVFQYVESNGSPGYQNGESMTNLLNFAASNWTTLDHSTEQAEGINVTLTCFSTSANSVLNVQACASEVLCNVDGDWLSPDGLHYLVNVTLPIISPNTHYGAVFAMGGATGKKTILYDPAGPSLVFSDPENPAVVGQVTWDGPGSRVVTSWKKGPNQMTFSFVDSGAWEPWAFDVKIKYIA